MRKALSIEEFILKSRTIHGYKYDYSKVEYVNAFKKICIICPIHGEFWQTPNNHLSGHGCPICSGNIKYTNDSFVTKANEVHSNKYDYSKVNYISNHNKVCIICPEHGEFYQEAKRHLEGCGCPKCYGNVRLTLDEFINKSKEMHGNKYDYSKVEYVNNSTKVCIICPEHGEFWQRPSQHLRGDGCPYCCQSKLEKNIEKIFPDFEKQKRFVWLKYKKYLSLDFYSSKYNISIECQGEQHFTSRNGFGGDDGFEKILYRDLLKYELCKEHNIDILYYFPEEYLKYDIDFYKDKRCFYNIDDLKKYIDKIDL